MNSETLQLYIKSIQHDFSHCAFKLEENGEKNTTYWKYRQKAIVEGVKEDLATKEYLEPYSSFKIDFTANVDFFTKYLFKFYEKAYTFSLGGKPNSYLTSIGIALMEFQQRLKNFKYHKSSLLHIKSEDPIAAHRTEKLIQLYFQKFLDEFMSCGIDLLKSPIGEDFNNIIKLFDGITSLDEIQIANKVSKTSKQEIKKIELEYLENKQPQTSKKDKIDRVKTKYSHIFSNNGFVVFEKIHAIYKNKKNPGANYSFLFYAMVKDNLIHSSGIEFIEFLSTNYNLHLDRIDSRQAGQNTRKDYYNEVKNAVIAQNNAE